MNPVQLLQYIADKISPQRKEKLIYGDPIEAHGKSFIPVTKSKQVSKHHTGNQQDEEYEEGEEAYGDIYTEPVGFLDISQSGTKFIPVNNTRKQLLMLSLGFSFGFVMGKLLTRK